MMSERACANESGQIEKLDRGGNRAERERERERERGNRARDFKELSVLL